MTGPDANAQALIDLLNGYIGATARYRSMRKMAQAVGKSHSTISSVLETGKASADVLVMLADELGEPRTRLLQLGGVLTPADLRAPDLSEVEAGLLARYGALSSESRQNLDAVMAGLLARDREQETADPAGS